MVMHVSNPSSPKAEIWVWGQLGLESKFQDREGYTEKPFVFVLEKKKTKWDQSKKKKTEEKQTKSNGDLWLKHENESRLVNQTFVCGIRKEC